MPGRRRFLQLLAGGAGAGALAVGSPPPALARSPGGVLTPDLGGDVRAALQRALDEAGALGGGTVLVVPGEHRLDGEVVVPSHVTLRGTSRTASRLVGGTVRHPAGVEGASVEDLTLVGGADGVRYEADGPAGLGATFCIARRLRIVDVAGSGVALRGGAYENLAAVNKQFYETVEKTVEQNVATVQAATKTTKAPVRKAAPKRK